MVLLLPLEDHHRCSIGFRSGETLGHSITFSFPNKVVVILVVCWGSLSCRSAEFLKGVHHVLLQNVCGHAGIHVFLNEAQPPIPAGLMQPQTMMLSPCLTEVRWFSCSSPGHRHTCWTPSEPNTFILVSSDHRTLFQ